MSWAYGSWGRWRGECPWGCTGRWLSDGLRQITFVLSSLKNKKSLLLGLIIKAQSIWSGFCQSMKVHGFWVWQKTWLFEVYCPFQFSSVQSPSHVRLIVTPWTAAHQASHQLSIYHQLPESTQTRVHWVGDAIQLSHPLSSPSPPALNLSQHQGLFQWVSSSHQVAKVWTTIWQ